MSDEDVERLVALALVPWWLITTWSAYLVGQAFPPR